MFACLTVCVDEKLLQKYEKANNKQITEFITVLYKKAGGTVFYDLFLYMSTVIIFMGLFKKNQLFMVKYVSGSVIAN